MCGHTRLLRMKGGPDCLLPRALWSPEGFVWGWLQGYPMQSPRLGDTLWRWPSWVPFPSLPNLTVPCEFSVRFSGKDEFDYINQLQKEALYILIEPHKIK